jgi:hypothetical protein
MPLVLHRVTSATSLGIINTAPVSNRIGDILSLRSGRTVDRVRVREHSQETPNSQCLRQRQKLALLTLVTTRAHPSKIERLHRPLRSIAQK